MIDTHSHILPGVDDGSRDFDASIEMLNGLKEQGFTDVILTPHYVPDTIFVSTRQDNKKVFKELQEKSPVKLHLGNELYIDRSLLDLLKKKKISSLADSKYLLVELPMSGEFDGYEDIFDSLKAEGYQVILAHPERYSSTHHDFTILEKLYADGILFQCNYGSFIGQYGKNSLKTAQKLARAKMIFTLGTDIHRPRDYSEITKSLKKLSKFYTAEELEKIITKNPQKILQSA